MGTIGIQGMHFSVFVPGDHDVLACNIDSFGAIFGQLMTSTHDIPPIGVCGDGLANIFFLGIIVSSHINHSIAYGPLVDGVSNKEKDRYHCIAMLSDEV